MRRLDPVLALLPVIAGLAVAAYGRSNLEEKQARSYAAFKEYLQVGRMLSEGKPRRQAAQRFLELANSYPDTERGVLSKELGLLLDKMADEDENFQPPADLAELSEEQRIHHYVFKLRDIADHDTSVPGSCNVIRDARVPDSPAVALRKMGKPAVPALIELLDDLRPTRSVGAPLNGAQVLRYCDAALQILEVITGQRFGKLNARNALADRGSYLSNIKPEYRSQIISGIKTWWQKNQYKSEDQWIRNALSEMGIGTMWDRTEISRRLIELQGDQSTSFFRERLKQEPDNPWAVSLLWEAGGKAVIEDIRPKVHHEDFYVRTAAYRALVEAGDSNIADTIIQDLHRALQQADEKPFYHRALISVLAQGSEEKAVLAAARCILHQNQIVAESTMIAFQTALQRGNEPSPELRRVVFPYMAAVLDNEDLKYWAAWWLINAGQIPFEYVSDEKSVAERDRMIQQIKLWWQEHKDEYPHREP
jgi:hypothetical protein